MLAGTAGATEIGGVLVKREVVLIRAPGEETVDVAVDGRIAEDVDERPTEEKTCGEAEGGVVDKGIPGMI